MFKREDYQLESGKLQSFAFPGGYPLYYLTRDNGVLCPDCANGEETRNPEDAQWFLVGAGINWEDPALSCDHCGKRIEPAYREGEQPCN